MGNKTRARRGIKGRTDKRWRDLAARLKATLPSICWVCGLPIDQSLHHTHRDSYTLDHVIPIDIPGTDPYDESNIRPAHRSCNGRRGAEFQNSRRGFIPGVYPVTETQAPPTRFSRRW